MLFQHTHIRSRFGRKTEGQWNRQQQSQSSYNLTFSTQKLDSFSFFFCFFFVSIPHYFYCYCFGSLTLLSIFFILAAVAHRTRTHRLGLSTFSSQIHGQSSSTVIHSHPLRPEKNSSIHNPFFVFGWRELLLKVSQKICVVFAFIIGHQHNGYAKSNWTTRRSRSAQAYAASALSSDFFSLLYGFFRGLLFTLPAL